MPNSLAGYGNAINTRFFNITFSNCNINGFRKYMKTIGRLGGQNKVPRLSNDRKIADTLKEINEDE